MVKVLLDTNVLITADRGAGSFGQRIIKLAIEGKITGVISRSVQNENILLVNKLIKDMELKNQILQYFAKCRQVNTLRINVRLEDKEDIKILAAAVAGSAQFLITEDRHLLDLEEYQGVKIIRPQDWWQWWEKQKDESGETWNTWAKNILGK